MPPWFVIWIVRFARGERWRKATREENRYGAGLFFLVAVYFIVFYLGISKGRYIGAFMDRASPVMLWVGGTAAGSALVFGSVFWARHVPTRVSTVLAIVAWSVLLSMIVCFEWLPR